MNGRPIRSLTSGGFSTCQVVYGNRSWSPNYVTGSTAAYLEMRNWSQLELGRVFTERELLSGGKVCLIGWTVVRELFGDRYPVGEEIRVMPVACCDCGNRLPAVMASCARACRIRRPASRSDRF